MIRPWAGTQTLTGSAQAVFGTTVTTAFTPPPDPFVNNLNPGSNETQVTIVVGSTKGFLPGDNILVGAAGTFKPGIATANADWGTVKSVVDSTHLIIQGLKQSHAANEWAVLDQPAGNVHIRPVVTSAAAYIGNASTVSSSDLSLLDILPIVAAAGTGPTYVFDAESIGGSQPFTTSEFWIIGTMNDTFLARWTSV
jgi:hypothetical protein